MRHKKKLDYALSLPERVVRATFAGIFGTVHESAELLLPRLVRRSRLYEVTAKNALRIAIELVGGVEAALKAGEAEEPSAGRVAVKKGVGNAVEFGSIAAFGFSPLWLLAGASDILNGSRVYLRALEAELVTAGILRDGTTFASVDDLLKSVQGISGTTASTIDMPPIEIAELTRSLGELRHSASELPTPAEMAALFTGLVNVAKRERRSLLAVSSGVGLAFLSSAKNVTRNELWVPYGEDLAPVREEGFGAYADRVSERYRRAISGHFDPEKETITSQVMDGSALGKVRDRLRRTPHRQ